MGGAGGKLRERQQRLLRIRLDVPWGWSIGSNQFVASVPLCQRLRALACLLALYPRVLRTAWRCAP